VRRPIAVAITGGIGAGKSTALDAFRAPGAATVSSDEIVHHLLATDDGVRDALVARLGEEILGADGRPDRARIAQTVFGDRKLLEWLEGLLHPLVSREYLQWREQLAGLRGDGRTPDEAAMHLSQWLTRAHAGASPAPRPPV
jgi:dephospho-CoA kinase